MENKEGSILSRVWRVAVSEYVRWICNPRMILILCLLVFVEAYVVDGLNAHSLRMGQPFSVWETFIAVANSTELCVAIPGVFLMLMGDFPRQDGNTLLYIHRSGRYCWLLGQVLMTVMAAVSYLAALILGCAGMSLGHGALLNNWSDVVTKYEHRFPDDPDLPISSLLTGRLYNNFSVGQALGWSLMLLFDILFFLMMLKLVCFLLGNATAGLVIGAFLIGSGWTLNLVDTSVKWVFPMAHVVVWQHCDEVFRTMEVSLSQSLLYFAVWIVALFLASVVLVERFNYCGGIKS